MRNLIFLIILTIITSLFVVTKGFQSYNSKLQERKDLIEKATPIDGKIDIEFLEETFSPANE